MPQKVKLTVRVDDVFLEGAKHYAAAHQISLSRLISEFLHTLTREDARTPDPPLLRKLTGVLPPQASIEDHRAYLKNKYGG
jgi:hypothetical protein